MFARYGRALQLINLRCFGNDVFLYHRAARVFEEIIEVGRTVGENLTLHDRIAFLDQRNARIRREIFVC